MCRMFLSTLWGLAVLVRVPAATAFRYAALTPHHVYEARLKNSRRILKAQQVDAAYQGYGTHYVDMWTGTPPQRQTLIIATGSLGVGFPCSNCLDCGHGYHVDRFFDERKSLTFKEVRCGDCEVGHCNVDSASLKCEAGFAYPEGSSWSGFEARDMAYMGGPHDKALSKGGDDEEEHDDVDPDQAREYQFELAFICQTTITGQFRTQLADGILGMGPSNVAYWHQAKMAKATNSSSFSLCFARQPTASRKGTEAGALTMGGTDPRLHNEDSPMVYGTYNGSEFNLNLKSIYLRTRVMTKKAQKFSVSISSNEIRVDSGTTYTYLPRSFETAFTTTWKALTEKDYHNQPVELTDENLRDLPTILLQFSGHEASNRPLGEYPIGTLGHEVPDISRSGSESYDLVVAMDPSHYMEYNKAYNHYTSRLYFDDLPTLGANFMMGHDVHFDVDHGRIGFAESDCDYLGLLDQLDESNQWENKTGKPRQERTETAQEASPERDISVWICVLVATTIIGAGLFVAKRHFDSRRAVASVYDVADENELELHVCSEGKESSSFTMA